MADCQLCGRSSIIDGIVLQSIKFINSIDYIRLEPEEYLCSNCTYEALATQVQKADDELEAALGELSSTEDDLRELRLFVAEGLFGGES